MRAGAGGRVSGSEAVSGGYRKLRYFLVYPKRPKGVPKAYLKLHIKICGVPNYGIRHRVYELYPFIHIFYLFYVVVLVFVYS